MPKNTPTVTVFITTASKWAAGSKEGRKFNLTKYPSHASFMAEAIKYKDLILEEPNGELYFVDFETSFKYLVYFHYCGLCNGDAISPSLWELLTMEHDDIDLLDAYIGSNKCRGNNFTQMLEEAKQYYIGHFHSNEALAKHQYAETLNAMPADVRAAVDMAALGKTAAKGLRIYAGYYFKPKQKD